MILSDSVDRIVGERPEKVSRVAGRLAGRSGVSNGLIRKFDERVLSKNGTVLSKISKLKHYFLLGFLLNESLKTSCSEIWNLQK